MVHGYLSIGILIISLASIYVSFLLLKKVSGIIKIPFVSTFFWLKYITFAYIGSVYINILPPIYEFNMGVYDRPDLVLNVWYYTTAGLFLIPLGMGIANWATKYNPYISTSKLLSKNVYITSLDKSNIMYSIIIIFLILSIFVVYLYYLKLGTLPVFGILDGLQKCDLAQLRSNATNNFDGKYYRYELFMKTLPLLLIIIVFFLKNEQKKWTILFYILLGYNFFVNIMDLQKAPAIKVILLLMLANFYSKNKINIKVFIIIGISLVGLLLLMYVFIMGMRDSSFYDIISSIAHRIFVVQIIGTYWIQLFQEVNGYIYGTSFPNPAHIFPFEYRQIAVELQNFVHPELAKLGIVGSAPTVFFADWFINFGPLMALFSMILFGFIIQMVDVYFITNLIKYKSVLLSALFIFMINYFARFAGTSFVGIIIDTNWIIPVFIIIFIRIMRQLVYNSLRRTSEKSNINSIKQFQK
jgi:hypothetical protein